MIDPLTTFLKILLVFFCIALAYNIYQLSRNNAVYKIRVRWIDTNDERFHKYTYDAMFKANKSNWYGLRWPTDVIYN